MAKKTKAAEPFDYLYSPEMVNAAQAITMDDKRRSITLRIAEGCDVTYSLWFSLFGKVECRIMLNDDLVHSDSFSIRTGPDTDKQVAILDIIDAARKREFDLRADRDDSRPQRVQSTLQDTVMPALVRARLER